MTEPTQPSVPYGETAEECYARGRAYQFGEGVPQDLKVASALYFRAAQWGLADAQYQLGQMCANGEGTDVDLPVAAIWYKLAAKQGHAGAQHALSVMYQHGHGVALNLDRAAALRHAAYEGGWEDPT